MDPLILALDTAAGAPSAAVLRGEALLAASRAAGGGEVVQSLLPLVARVLAEAGTSLDDLEAFALAIGPGSFTSLRVGVASVKGLAFGSGRPVAPVSSLRALALGAGDPGRPVVAVLDARRGEVYAAAWADRDRVWSDAPLLPEGIYRPAELRQELGPGAWQEVGDTAVLSPARLPEQTPAAVRVGQLGLRELRAGRGVPAGSLVPRYLRRAQAEVLRARFDSRERPK